MKSDERLPQPRSVFEHGAVIRFQGGPLDGSQIFTDEYPNTEYLIHRHFGREHLYRYQATKDGGFRAEYDGYLQLDTSLPFREKPRLTVLKLSLFAMILLSILAILLFFCLQIQF